MADKKAGRAVSSSQEEAVDEMIAAGHAPWIVARTGWVFRIDPGERFWPEHIDLPNVPRLDGTTVPGLIDDRGVDGCWYVPEHGLVAADLDPDDEFADDVGFRFDAQQTGEVASGARPFNRATLSFSVSNGIPSNVSESHGDRVNLSEIPDLAISASLSIPVTAQDGSPQVHAAASVAHNAASGNYFFTFDLTGDDVALAYVHLTLSGAAELHITATYSGYQKILIPGSAWDIQADGIHWFGDRFVPVGDGAHDSSKDLVPFDPDRDTCNYIPVTARFDRTIPLGLAFNTDRFRSRFMFTFRGTSRPIIDVDDLNQFAGTRSEYRELTTLGNVPDRYRSLLRLYLGQVSGTVVAVPAAYGIVRSAHGLAASCDSIIDPEGINGCRFDFTFTIAPIVDPVDLASLVSDLRSVPEAAARTLQVILPSGLDPRHPSGLDGLGSATSAFTVGFEPHTVQVSVEIADTGSTPATTNANLFLHQLASGEPAPLFGNLFVRIDDLLAQPVVSHAALSLRQTACSDELVTELTSDPTPGALASNHGPFDLVMQRFALVDDTGVRITALPNQVLAAGQTTILTTDVTDSRSVEISRTLSLPTPLPKEQLLQLVTFNTQVVQKLQHPLTVNATGVNFAVDNIGSIEVRFSLTRLPELPIPTLTLSSSHAIDFVHVSVPVTAAVAGLECSVSLTVTTRNGSRTLAMTHDFVAEPILVVTSHTLEA